MAVSFLLVFLLELAFSTSTYSSQIQRAAFSNDTAAPTAAIRNGTLVGRYLGHDWDQDLFLGVPYAQPPIGDLRFRWPRSLNETFGTRNATHYGFSCYQYNTNFLLSEDCLTLNVIRPHTTNSTEPLPVLVWIYGGGLYTGSTADPQYNLSGIVKTAADSGYPVVGVSINYRLAVWGFLQSVQVQAEGSSNAGLLDQRLALRWIQENIAAFNGDPTRVTVWGESAGAQSLGYHLFSYGGRNDNLFQAAILESGGPEGTSVQDLAYYASPFENLTRTTGCYTASNQLVCLRSLSSEFLFAARVSQTWNPLIDGDFLPAYPSQLIPTSSFLKVPLLLGANSDEGTSFGPRGPSLVDNASTILNTLLSYRSYALTPPTAATLLDLYPNDSDHETPFHLPPDATIPASYGAQYRRAATLAGDLVIIAQRRRTAQLMAAAGQPVYSYRFDTPLYNGSALAGAQHFVNVVFSFQNISGALGPLPQFQSYRELSLGIGRAYARFAYGLSPSDGEADRDGEGGLPAWPRYDVASPKNLVLSSNGSFVEEDTFREEGIGFINRNEVWRELLA